MIEGKVIATRCPCNNSGDLRVFKCIQNKKLEFLYVNVVVFSSKGKRPACNLLSCGDLDGDIYFISWNKTLIDHINET